MKRILSLALSGVIFMSTYAFAATDIIVEDSASENQGGEMAAVNQNSILNKVVTINGEEKEFSCELNEYEVLKQLNAEYEANVEKGTVETSEFADMSAKDLETIQNYDEVYDAQIRDLQT